jgi:hypothetical protein
MIAGTMGAFALHGLVPAFAGTADQESCFVSAINSARASAGVASLSVQGDLLAIARSWSQTMANAGSISHNPNLANVAPSNWQNLGENVGVGPSCDSLAQAFMNSPEHRKNILDPAFSTVGVGVVDSADGTIWVTEDFMGTGAAAVPVVAHVPAPVVSVTPLAPNVVVAAPAPTHVAPPAPAKSAPAPLPSHVAAVEKPAPLPTPAAAQIPVATPIVDEILTVQGNRSPDAAPTAGSGQRGLFSTIASFLSHLV